MKRLNKRTSTLTIAALCSFVVTAILGHPLNNWQKRVSGATNDLNGIAFGAGSFVAVGEQGLILKSTNGLDWTRVEVAITNRLNGITFLQDEFFALGVGIIARSTNGSHWTILNAGNTSWYDVIFDGGRFLLCGYEQLEITTNFLDYTTARVTSPSAYTGLYRAGRYYFAGERGDIQISTNALDWTAVLANGCYIGKLTFFGGRYFAVGCQIGPPFSSVGYASTNGTQWETLSDLVTPGMIFSDLAQGGGWLVAVGSSGTIRATKNAQNWADFSVGGQPPLSDNDTWANHICYGLGTFVAVGDKSGIWQSAPVLPQLFAARDGTRIALSWPTNYTDFILEASVSLGNATSWSMITNAPAIIDSDQVVTLPGSNSAGFFRLKQQ